MRRLLSNRLPPRTVVALAALLLLIGIAAAGPWFYPLGSTEIFEMSRAPFTPPSAVAPLGTNALGQDVLGLLLLGARTSFAIGILAGLIATVIGVLIGMVAGFKGGLLDNALSALTNLLIVVPQLVILVLICNSVAHRSYALLAAFVGTTSWAWVARALRAQTASLRHRDHIALARLNGLSTFAILRKHILPYVLSYVFMAFVMQLGAGIFAESALSMLGLGLSGTEVISLGTMLHQAVESGAFTDGLWWVFLPPTVVITVTVYLLYLLNTSLEQAFNPRLRRH